MFDSVRLHVWTADNGNGQQQNLAVKCLGLTNIPVQPIHLADSFVALLALPLEIR